MRTIPRDAFTRAIKQGLQASNSIAVEDANKLLAVANTATAVGRNYLDGPGCPLHQAGIVTVEMANSTRAQMAEVGWPKWADAFVEQYDRAMQPFWFDYHGNVREIG